MIDSQIFEYATHTRNCGDILCHLAIYCWDIWQIWWKSAKKGDSDVNIFKSIAYYMFNKCRTNVWNHPQLGTTFSYTHSIFSCDCNWCNGTSIVLVYAVSYYWLTWIWALHIYNSSALYLNPKDISATHYDQPVLDFCWCIEGSFEFQGQFTKGRKANTCIFVPMQKSLLIPSWTCMRYVTKILPL